MMHKYWRIFLFLAPMLFACTGGFPFRPTPTPTPTVTPTATPTATPSPTPTFTPTYTPQPTNTPVPTETPLPEACYVVDILEALKVQVPCTWEEFDPEPIFLEDIQIASLVAAPSLEAFDLFQGPGIWVMASRDLAKLGGFAQILDTMRRAFYPDCTVDEGRVDYNDGYYRGLANFYTCDQIYVFHLVARPDTQDDYPPFLVVVIVHLTQDMEDDPFTVLSDVLATFDVNPRSLP